MKDYKKYYHVAGITVQVTSDFPICKNTFHPKFQAFEIDGPGMDNIYIHHHFHQPDIGENFNLEDIVFEDHQWQIYKGETEWIYKYTPLLENTGFESVGIFNHDHSDNHIYSDKITESIYQNYAFGALTLLNNDQVLFAKLLSDRNGIIIHSNGFKIENSGFLVAGPSGVGKSTLSTMLKYSGHKILCDDRMFTIKKKDGFWAYGSWCHGTVPDTSSMAAPLKAIFFLEQASENTIVPITNKKVILESLIRSLVKPLMAPDGWKNTFKIINSLADDVHCYELKFDLSGKICTLMEKIIR